MYVMSCWLINTYITKWNTWFKKVKRLFPTSFHLACKVLELCCLYLQPFRCLSTYVEIHQHINAMLLWAIVK